MKPLLAAISFCTRVPVPGADRLGADDVARGVIWFPAVGAMLGVLQWAIVAAVGSAWLGAVLATAAVVWITGAFHLDGLADTADGLGGGRDRDDVLRIMKDPRVGTFGAAALTLALTTRIAALATLDPGMVGPWAITAAALGRGGSVMLARALPYARSDGGLGSVLTDGAGWPRSLAAAISAAGLAWWLLGSTALAAIVVTALAVALVGSSCRRRIGGITGDGLGAATEIAEISVLVLGALIGGSR